MQTELQLEFQNIAASPDLRSLVERHVSELKTRFGRITACRVMVKAPSAHHRTGGLLDVAIHLSLPNGQEVAVNHASQNDERHAKPEFAIADAFKRARRQLQDVARIMQGEVKRSRTGGKR